MSKFLNGPAAGKSLLHKRAPVMLRVVQDADGNFDVLDMPEDEPQPDEAIFVYIAVPNTFSSGHVTRTPRSKSFWFNSNDYVLFDPQPENGEARHRESWERWCDGLTDDQLVKYGHQPRGD